MSRLREALYRLAAEWDESASTRIEDPTPFKRMVDEVLFHADLRYRDYKQFPQEGDFPARLSNWLNNVKSSKQKQLLFQLLLCLIFIDRAQMRSLYREAYRSIISPWLAEPVLTAADFLASDFDGRMRALLQQVMIFSLTQSFDFNEFRSTNSLAGIEKPTILPERPQAVKAFLLGISDNPERIIVVEDFVGSGSQACRILALLVQRFPQSNVLFVPLTILESGYRALKERTILNRVRVEPVFQVSRQICLEETPIEGERCEFKAIRGLIKKLRSRVIERLNQFDDCPDNEFGHAGGGALVVSAHNSPNNTLPIVHHRAPHWVPLFRRLHHAYQVQAK